MNIETKVLDGSSTWMLKSSQIAMGRETDNEPENAFFDKWRGMTQNMKEFSNEKE